MARMQPVHLIGVPLDLGGGRRGVDMGPSAFRIAGLGEQIGLLGHGVVDRGNVPAPLRESGTLGDERKKYVDDIAGVCRRVYEAAYEALAAGALPLVLGGDHSLGGGIGGGQRGLGHPRVVVSARPDLGGRPWRHEHPRDLRERQRPRHAAGGTAGLGTPGARRRSGSGAAVSAQHTVLVGIRNLDDREKDQIRAAGVHVFTMKDIDREGMARVAERAIAAASAGTGGIHVSFDLDACDPSIAPGVGTPVRGGLGYREAHLLMELVADSKRLVALDLVEVNPTLDIRNTTAELGTELALSALGKNIL